MSLLKSIHHVAIICSDYTVSKKFYTEILGFKIEREVFRTERNSHKLDLSLNGLYTLELFSFPNPPARPSRPEAAGLRHLAFKVENLDQAIAQVTKLGVTVESIRTDEYTQKRFTFIFDPDQLPIELYEE